MGVPNIDEPMLAHDHPEPFSYSPGPGGWQICDATGAIVALVTNVRLARAICSSVGFAPYGLAAMRDLEEVSRELDRAHDALARLDGER